MNKLKIGIILLVIVYLGLGTAYSQRESYCEEQRLLANPALNSGNKEDEGSNLIGRSVTTLFWPVFIVSDKINHAGVFDCKK